MVLHRPELLGRHARRHLYPLPDHRRSLGRTHRRPHRTRPRHPRPRPPLHGSLPCRRHPIPTHLRRRRDGNDRRTKPPLLAAHRLHLRLTSLPPILPPPLLPRRRHTLQTTGGTKRTEVKPDIADVGRCRKGRLKCLAIRGRSPRYKVCWQHKCRSVDSVHEND